MEDDFKRLSEVGSPEEKALIAAARAYQPPDLHQQRLFVALGVGVSGGLAAASVAGSAQATGLFAKLGATLSGLSAAGKVLVVVGVAAVGGTSAYAVKHELDSQRATPSVVVRPTIARNGQVSSGLPANLVPVAGLDVSPVSSTAVPSPAATQKIATPSPIPSFKDELGLIQAAQIKFQQGDPTATLALLERHQRMFAHPKLALEAQSLRIRALDAAGQKLAAQSEARAFVTRYPRSLLAQPLLTIAHFPKAQSTPSTGPAASPTPLKAPQ